MMLKDLVPPILMRLYSRTKAEHFIYYYGDYATWEEAEKDCRRMNGGYDRQSILDKVILAAEKVRCGEAAYDQDGVCFDRPDNNYAFIASMLYVHQIIGKLTVLDLGGHWAASISGTGSF